MVHPKTTFICHRLKHFREQLCTKKSDLWDLSSDTDMVQRAIEDPYPTPKFWD